MKKDFLGVVSRRLTTGVVALLLSGTMAETATAINLTPTLSGFTSAQEDVINAAIEQWQGLFNGHDITVNFSVDNSLDVLASTGGWVPDAQGRPTSANIAVRENIHNWTTGAPMAGIDDALDTVMHELGHAIGWTVNLPNFNANVRTVGENRFYDLNSDGVFSAAADFDLIDDPEEGTHAPSGSGDLMQPETPAGQRNYPNFRHAAVLVDAFDYDIILDGFGGPAGFGDLAMGRNDDGSSNELNLPFEINFFGNAFNNFWINNNGNLTFNSPLSTFTPDPFPVANQPMIAPYWGDVDTQCDSCGAVYVASPNANTVVVTWDSVGYFPQSSDLTNTFQTILRNRSDTGAGNFDVEFRYGQLEWTTGDASGGSGGLGGTPAQAGFDAGDNTNFLTLPGSLTGNVLNLQNTSNLPLPIPGIWSYAIRSGDLPGSTPDNPLLPVVTEDGWQFDFNIGDISDRIFVDPEVAIGYDFIVDSGPNFDEVLLPTGIGDNLYDLWLFNSGLGDYVDTGTDLTGGVPFAFSPSVDRFRILGIEVDAMLDPGDVTAFVTGLSFDGTGPVSLRQVPITTDTDVRSVPEPTTSALIYAGLAGLGFAMRQRKKRKQN